MAGLWVSPNKTASCSLVWRNLSSEALSGLVMSRRHIIKRNICAAQRGSSAHFLITPPTLNMHKNPRGCVYVFSWRTRWWRQIWHQLNRPTTVTVLKQTVCLNGNCQLNLFYLLQCCWDLLMCLLRNFPGGKYIYIYGGKYRPVIERWNSSLLYICAISNHQHCRCTILKLCLILNWFDRLMIIYWL